MDNKKQLWDFNQHKRKLYFSDLKLNTEYKFLIENMYQLILEHNKSQREVSFFCRAMHDMKHVKGKISSGDEIELNLWRAFYQKWKECQDYEEITSDKVVFSIIKISERKWYIKQIKNYR